MPASESLSRIGSIHVYSPPVESHLHKAFAQHSAFVVKPEQVFVLVEGAIDASSLLALSEIPTCIFSFKSAEETPEGWLR